ncbi:MAG: cupin domain-containing protein [Deltaproteobacteria bacterium]
MKYKIWVLTGFLMMLPLLAYTGEYDTGVKGEVILETETMTNGEPIDYLDADHPKVTVMMIEIAPGAQTGWHSHPIEVYAYVISGQITMSIEGGKTTTFNEGAAFVEVVKFRHNGVNNGKVPVKLVAFYLGAKGVPNVMKTDKP